jgi:hypothetical protein
LQYFLSADPHNTTGPLRGVGGFGEREKMGHLSLNDLVIIVWLDSVGVTSSWEFNGDVEPLPPSECTSAGFLVDDTPTYKTIVMTTSDSQVLGRLTIPAGAIVSIRKVG